jgi:DNA-binding response OmpR family regulator
VRLISRILSREGYEVFTATDGQECLALLKREKPQLILLDVNMPGMDGGQIVTEVQGKKLAEDVPIIFLTGILTEQEAAGRDIGGHSFISKYSDPAEIVRRVKKILPPGPRPDAGQEQPASRSVLVVDDNPEIRGLLQRFLDKKGFSSVTASTGEEALEKLGTRPAQAVLLDIRLPGIDGLATLKRIREMSSAIRVIMITGVGDENNASEALRLGAAEYIVKPIDLNYLTLSLQTAFMK